jgi:hypothetical protein
MGRIHNEYNNLTDDEQTFVDAWIDWLFDDAKFRGIKLANDDRIERVAEAIAVCIQQSKES